MSGVDTTRWAQLSPLLDELLDLDEGARETRLARLRLDDQQLADELGALLARQGLIDRERFLEGSAFGGRAPTLAGQTIGAYTLERPLGAGGMGSVWLARRSDGRYEGLVAVKLLHLALLARGGAERFAREGSLLARLAHPNIARLLDTGVTPGGEPYLVLEHIEGEPIDPWCDARPLGIEARVRLMLDVLAAVAHAHSKRVLHRGEQPLCFNRCQSKFAVAPSRLNACAASSSSLSVLHRFGRRFDCRRIGRQHRFERAPRLTGVGASEIDRGQAHGGIERACFCTGRAQPFIGALMRFDRLLDAPQHQQRFTLPHRPLRTMKPIAQRRADLDRLAGRNQRRCAIAKREQHARDSAVRVAFRVAAADLARQAQARLLVRSKELLVRDEDVQVMHGFDSAEQAKAYLTSTLFSADVVTALKPLLQGGPDVRIYMAV